MQASQSWSEANYRRAQPTQSPSAGGQEDPDPPPLNADCLREEETLPTPSGDREAGLPGQWPCDRTGVLLLQKAPQEPCSWQGPAPRTTEANPHPGGTWVGPPAPTAWQCYPAHHSAVKWASSPSLAGGCCGDTRAERKPDEEPASAHCPGSQDTRPRSLSLKTHVCLPALKTLPLCPRPPRS